MARSPIVTVRYGVKVNGIKMTIRRRDALVFIILNSHCRYNNTMVTKVYECAR